MLCFYLTNEIVFNIIRLNKKRFPCWRKKIRKQQKQNECFYYIDYNTGEWVKNKNRGRVEGYNDRDIVELDKKLVIVQKKIGGEVKDVEVWRPINIKKVPFIAIVPKPADDYKYRTYAQSNDFYIEITK